MAQQRLEQHGGGVGGTRRGARRRGVRGEPGAEERGEAEAVAETEAEAEAEEVEELRMRHHLHEAE